VTGICSFQYSWFLDLFTRESMVLANGRPALAYDS